MLDLNYIRQNAIERAKDNTYTWIAPDRVLAMVDEIERLRAAIRDAHGLIDNDLVIPWIIAHKLDGILGINEQEVDRNTREKDE